MMTDTPQSVRKAFEDFVAANSPLHWPTDSSPVATRDNLLLWAGGFWMANRNAGAGKRVRVSTAVEEVLTGTTMDHEVDGRINSNPAIRNAYIQSGVMAPGGRAYWEELIVPAVNPTAIAWAKSRARGDF